MYDEKVTPHKMFPTKQVVITGRSKAWQGDGALEQTLKDTKESDR